MKNDEGITLLEARGIARRKPGSDRWLLRDIDLTMNGGSRLAVIGPTGSGKTLLLRALARLDALDAGEVYWKGEAVAGDTIPFYRREAVYLHQRPVLLEGTVEDNLRIPFTFRVHRGREFSRPTVIGLLEQVGRTEGFLQRSGRDLSGGEAQIVALLRAIQLQPALLLLDEPTAALDETSTHLVEQLVNGWFEESPDNRAVAWVSHNQNQVARVANRMMTMSNGRLASRQSHNPESLP